MWKGFSYLLRKDFRMMLSGKFFLIAFFSLILYSFYINLVYVNLEQVNYQVYLYDPKDVSSEQSKYITKVKNRQELENACKDNNSVGIDLSINKPEIYMQSLGTKTMDNYRILWAKAVLSGKTGEETKLVGAYNKEQKSRREITAEVLFFEISAVGFLGLASILFKEKQMGVIRVHGILPVNKCAFIASKLLVILLSDLVFTILLTWINVGVYDSLTILPLIFVQTGILSLIMALIGFFCAVWLPDFKQFSLFYLVLAVFITTPVFLAGQTGISWKWIIYHPMYHLFTSMKSAYFGTLTSSLSYYFVCIGTIAVLFYLTYHILTHEMTKEG